MVEEITKERLEKKVGDRRGSAFVEDLSIPEKYRARLKDYFRSGYDRGHLVRTSFYSVCLTEGPGGRCKDFSRIHERDILSHKYLSTSKQTS